MSVFKDVEEFNLEVIGYEPKKVENLSLADESWLVSAFLEEIHEFMTAPKLHNKVDAVMDLIYYAAGYLTKIGLTHEDSEKIFKRIHECNMEKKKGARGRRAVNTQFDAYKPDGWEGPEEFIKTVIDARKKQLETM